MEWEDWKKKLQINAEHKKEHKEKPTVRQNCLGFAQVKTSKDELKGGLPTCLKRCHTLEQKSTPWCHPVGCALKGMRAEGHPGPTIHCCVSAALQRHDDTLVKRDGIHSALCRMRGHAESTVILIGDVFLLSWIVKSIINFFKKIMIVVSMRGCMNTSNCVIKKHRHYPAKEQKAY